MKEILRFSKVNRLRLGAKMALLLKNVHSLKLFKNMQKLCIKLLNMLKICPKLKICF